MKMVVRLALILTFSPGEKEQPLFISGFANTCPANPAARISVRRITILLLLGEKAGMRECVHQTNRHSALTALIANAQSDSIETW